MPNYNIVIDNSRFTPFSFAEKIAPLLMYKEQYEKDEERYLQLAEKMGDLQYAVANSKGVVKNVYDAYNSELTLAASAFMNGPMTALTRRLLSNLRKDYGLKIRGIEKAQEALVKEADLRRKEIANDPSKVYRTSNLSIDDFYAGNLVDNHSLSGTTMRAETADMASKYALAVYSNPEWSKIEGNPYYQLVAILNGAEVAMLDYVRSGSWKSIPHGENATLAERDLYNNIKGFADIYNSQMARTEGYSDADKASIELKVYEGLYAGLAKPKYDFLRDPGVMSASEKDSSARGWANYNLLKLQHEDALKMSGFIYNPTTKEWEYDSEKDLNVKKAEAQAKVKAEAAAKIAEAKGTKSGSNRVPLLKTAIIVGTYRGDLYDSSKSLDKQSEGWDKNAGIAESATYENSAVKIPEGAILTDFLDLNNAEIKLVLKAIGTEENSDLYRYYTYRDGHDHKVMIVPNNVKIANTLESFNEVETESIY